MINCDCGQPSVQRTAQKDGPNQGRDFLCCSKGRDVQCRFFQWTDETDQNARSTQGGSQVIFFLLQAKESIIFLFFISFLKITKILFKRFEKIYDFIFNN